MEIQRTQSFDVYSLLGKKLVSVIRKKLPKTVRKSLKDRDILHDFVVDWNDKSGDQTIYILTEEFFFVKMGSQVIFPESPTILDNLLKARYSLESSEGFDLPFESFILATPKGYRFEGIEIPSMLITWKSDQESNLIHPFLDSLNVPRHKFIFKREAKERVLSINYPEAGSPEKNRTFLAKEHLPDILASRNPEEYRQLMARKGFIPGVSAMTDEDSAIQFYAFKLVAALGVYNTATHGEKLRSGYPTGSSPLLHGWQPEQKMMPLTLSNSVPPVEEREGRASHYRSWYFRQLRADRYYKGEYANYAPGSRYSFVQETMVGIEVSPHTQA